MHPRAIKELRALFDELCDSYEELMEEKEHLAGNLDAAKAEIERLDDLVSELGENLEIADARIELLKEQVEALT